MSPSCGHRGRATTVYMLDDRALKSATKRRDGEPDHAK